MKVEVSVVVPDSGRVLREVLVDDVGIFSDRERDATDKGKLREIFADKIIQTIETVFDTELV